MFSLELFEYAEELYGADNIGCAYRALEKQVYRLGFDGLLYTYIPSELLQGKFSKVPNFQISSHLSEYQSLYEKARSHRIDPVIRAVNGGIKTPLNWRGDICKAFTFDEKESQEVIEAAWRYGIRNGVTLPLTSGSNGLSVASVVVSEKSNFEKLLRERLEELNRVSLMYNNLVLANSGYLAHFIRPIFASLNKTEIQYLAGLAEGTSQRKLALNLNRSEKYLEQVMLKIRRKVSGVGPLEKPSLNRNQLLYYAGLVNVISYAEEF